MPGCPHGYPLVERESSFSAGFSLAWKTKGYALFRYLHLCLFGLIGGLAVAALLGLAVPLTLYVHEYAGAGVALAGFAAMALFGLPIVRKKLLGTLCGHVACITELVTRGEIGNGEQSTFAFARELVQTRLGELESLWAVHYQVNGSLRQFYRVLDRVDDWMPIDLSFVESFTRRMVAWATPYVEAVIISYGLARGDRDFAAAAIDGLCYCAQNAKEVFKTALRVAIWEKIMMFPVWLVSLAAFLPSAFYLGFVLMGGDFPALMADPGEAAVDDGLAFVVGLFVAIFVGGGAALFAVTTVRESMVEPILVAMVIVRFHVLVENQPLDTSIKHRITSAGIALDDLDSLTLRMQRHAPA